MCPPNTAPAGILSCVRRRSRETLAQPSRARLLVVGCGPAGLAAVRELQRSFDVTVVEPRDYFEYTPGVLRTLGEPEHLDVVQVDLRRALEGMDVELVKGKVTRMDAKSATISKIADGSTTFSLDFDFALITAGSVYQKSSWWKVSGRPGEEAQTTCSGRADALGGLRHQLRSLERLGGAVVVVGAGLVGVELAGELAHYMPGLKVVICSSSSTVLPDMPSSAQKYAERWLTRNGVELKLACRPTQKDLPSLGLNSETLMLDCTGVRVHCEFASALGCLDLTGQIRVDSAMRVLTPTGPLDHIFAAGDCVNVTSLTTPLPKDMGPAEACAEVAVGNLLRAVTPKVVTPAPLQELAGTSRMLLCSLGPDDGVVVMNGYTVLRGWGAAKMKAWVEAAKLGQLRSGEASLGARLWSMVPLF